LSQLAASSGARALTVGIRPEHITFGRPASAASVVDLPMSVIDRECCGDRDLLRVDSELGRMNVELTAPSGIQPGDRLQGQLPRDRLHLFDAQSGRCVHHGVPAC
jgi:ABC-type sugar transport system ATPase subunit